jgi:hypothetical protein
VTLAALAALMLPVAVRATSHEESGTAAEIKALIMAGNAYNTKHLKDQEGGVSKDGSIQFWSSGGLMQWVGPDSTPAEYDSSSIEAKHITVIELPGGESAVAMYYSEGSFKVKGQDAVDHYMTRAMEVYVKEDGKWVIRASHWSPIAAGSGTSQTSVDE